MEIISFIVAIAVLVIVLKLISIPFKIIVKFLINSVIGGIVLAVLSMLGIGIQVNGLMVVLTGLFGIPGMVVAIILSAIF